MTTSSTICSTTGSSDSYEGFISEFVPERRGLATNCARLPLQKKCSSLSTPASTETMSGKRKASTAGTKKRKTKRDHSSEEEVSWSGRTRVGSRSAAFVKALLCSDLPDF
eukprot:907213-Rhodomonas_salina.1